MNVPLAGADLYYQATIWQQEEGWAERRPMASEWFMAQLQALRVLPVVTLDHPTSGVEVAHALASAGLTCAEVSLRTEGAVEAITAMARALPDMLIGAGTVMRTGQVDAAVAAGVGFVASPVVDPAVIERARRVGMPVIPGVERDTDAIAAARAGARVVRLSVRPGVDALERVHHYERLFPGMQFVPVGPIATSELAGLLREPSVLAVGTTRLTRYGAGAAEVRAAAGEAAGEVFGPKPL